MEMVDYPGLVPLSRGLQGALDALTRETTQRPGHWRASLLPLSQMGTLRPPASSWCNARKMQTLGLCEPDTWHVHILFLLLSPALAPFLPGTRGPQTASRPRESSLSTQPPSPQGAGRHLAWLIISASPLVHLERVPGALA